MLRKAPPMGGAARALGSYPRDTHARGLASSSPARGLELSAPTNTNAMSAPNSSTIGEVA